MHTLIDANGVVDLSAYPALLAVTDGVILDIKAWGEDVYKRLTGVERKAAVEKNIRMLAQNGKLFEL